mgnify:CR=1 FL=1
MFCAFTRASTQETGQSLETAVFNKLRRTASSVRAGSLARLTFEHDAKSHEIDFVTGDALLGDIYQLTQVSVSLGDQKTRMRELSALEAGMAKFGVAKSTMVTMDTEKTVTVPSGTVHIVPTWQWLLD